jgi:hypothetical protein
LALDLAGEVVRRAGDRGAVEIDRRRTAVAGLAGDALELAAVGPGAAIAGDVGIAALGPVRAFRLADDAEAAPRMKNPVTRIAKKKYGLTTSWAGKTRHQGFPRTTNRSYGAPCLNSNAPPP